MTSLQSPLGPEAKVTGAAPSSESGGAGLVWVPGCGNSRHTNKLPRHSLASTGDCVSLCPEGVVFGCPCRLDISQG